MNLAKFVRGMPPTRMIAIAFTIVVLVGAILLMLPIASATNQPLNFFDALFTSVSAVTVTGLSTIDVSTSFSMFGHVAIAMLIEVGGFGIVGFAALMGLLLEGRLSLRNRMMTSSESALGPSARDVKGLLRSIAVFMIGFQAVLFVILFVRFIQQYGYSFSEALGHGLFHAVSSFNNAGFALYADSMMRFAQDPFVMIPIVVVVFLATLGFPVLVEIRERLIHAIRRWKNPQIGHHIPRQWSLNSRIIIWASIILSVLGAVFIAALEWNNPATLGPESVIDKITNSLFAGLMPRSAGFNSVDTTAMTPTTWLGMEILMFIGGASASTAGGIKIGTFVVLVAVVVAEVRGEAAVNIGNRRLPRSMQRQALSIVAITASVVIAATMYMHLTTDYTLDKILFEVISATGTVGLSSGITASLPDHVKVLFSLLMLFGRLGPIVVATSLALRKTQRHFEYPRERPLIG